MRSRRSNHHRSTTRRAAGAGTAARLPAATVALAAAWVQGSWATAAREAAPAPPNVVLIVVDDMGFSDAGCYGGEIETPNLDRLATGGLRFTQFYNTGRCWTTRASLMTGLYPHQSAHAMPWGPDAPAAYRGTTREVAPMLPELLGPAGFRNYHAGKWHLDSRGRPFKETGPLARGFDRSLCFRRQDNHFNPFLISDGWEAIGRPAGDAATGDGRFYSTTAMTGRAVADLRAHAAEHADRPFLLYLAYTAPHFPLHGLPEDIAKFRGRYRSGWDAVRRKRWERLRELGILGGESGGVETHPLPDRDPDAVAWESLSDEERDDWDIRMAIHAAMVHRIDACVGQVVDQLEAMGVLEDTLILFLSDNGASAEFLVRGDGHDPEAPPGSGASYLCLEVGWANASNAPFRLHKMWMHEGGIATPLIAHWPGGIAPDRRGSLVTEPAHVIDVVPTILELAGTSAGDEDRDSGRPGRSLVPLLKGTGPWEPHPFLFWEHIGNRAIRRGDWKLVAEDGGPWELYDLSRDRGETRDLSKDPGRRTLVDELRNQWSAFADRIGVVEWSTLPQSQAKPSPEYRRK